MGKRVKKFSTKAYGNSMFPFLQDGDRIEYVQVPFHKVNINDIILTYVDNILVSHRVIYITKDTCITRGDNNLAADEPIQKAKILAKLIRFKRKGVWYGLQDAYYLQSSFYIEELTKLETAFKQHKIPHVFLKGVLISLRYEGFIPKRIYADCDILIQRKEYHTLVKVFKKLRYHPVHDYLDSFTSLKKPNERAEISFYKIVNNIPIIFDIHFEPVFLITQLKGMNYIFPKKGLVKLGSDIIERGKEIKINSIPYPLCSVADQILYLALHIFSHNYTDSIRYQLLSSVIKRKGSKKIFQELTHTISEAKLEGYVYPVFLLLNKYFKKTIPQSFIRAIAPTQFKQLVAKKIIKNVYIFSHDSRDSRKIISLFLLSSEPFLKKLLFFFHYETLFAVLWVLRKRCQFLFRLYKTRLYTLIKK